MTRPCDSDFALAKYEKSEVGATKSLAGVNSEKDFAKKDVVRCPAPATEKNDSPNGGSFLLSRRSMFRSIKADFIH